MSPIVSQQQNKAMHAASEGRSTLGIPKSVGQDFVAAGPISPHLPRTASALEATTGIPSGRKKIRRGGKPRGRGAPHQKHHTALNQAMAAGDLAKAKGHALNLANALHAHMNATAPDEPDTAGPDEPEPMPVAAPKPVNSLGSLAAILRGRK